MTSGRGMSNLIRFGINRSLQSIFCSSIFDYDYDARQKIDGVPPALPSRVLIVVFGRLYFPRKSGHIFLVVGYVKQVVFELFWRLIIE